MMPKKRGENCCTGQEEMADTMQVNELATKRCSVYLCNGKQASLDMFTIFQYLMRYNRDCEYYHFHNESEENYQRFSKDKEPKKHRALEHRLRQKNESSYTILSSSFLIFKKLL